MAANLPNFLEDYGALYSHLQSNFDGLNSYERGKRFAAFAEKLLPHSEVGSKFSRPQPQQESYDGGVDLIASSLSGQEKLLVQSKYTIGRVDTLDEIFSKFRNFEATSVKESVQGELSLDSQDGSEHDVASHQYLIVTASRIDDLLKKYHESSRASVAFYKRLLDENRFSYVDGPALCDLLRATYRRAHVMPSNVELEFSESPLSLGDVYIGIVPCAELRRLYGQYGDALFLENIREWLGQVSRRVHTGGYRETPNQAITKTLEEEPERFLARNNGITFRARHVQRQPESNSSVGKLSLSEASIVNGCQTTMAVVTGPHADAHVLVKVVVSQDSWDIAQAANFQNEVERIELELARDLRPQIVRTAASRLGFGFRSTDEEDSAFAVLDEIYQHDVVYEELRSLFIGLFSKTPNNAIERNYTELRHDWLADLSQNTEKEEIFEALFLVHEATSNAATKLQDRHWSPEVSDLFQRFWKEGKFPYRAFISIVAMCYFAGRNIFESKTSEFDDLKRFLFAVQNKIDADPLSFENAFRVAFVALAQDVIKPDIDKNELLQTMYRKVRSARVENLLNRISLMVDAFKTS